NVPRQSLLELGFTDADLDDPNHSIYEPVGCNECREGYKGRVGIYEVMKVDPNISRIIMEDGNAIDIKDAALKNGFRDLRRSGILKVLQGVTSIQEMMRVTSE
ncbi:ATPase, T2SS/T4P/T4SS family, partial [Psychrobacter sp. 1U2]